jgi:hypothetical protein
MLTQQNQIMVKDLWAEFANYVTRPYQSDAVRMQPLSLWGEKLASQREALVLEKFIAQRPEEPQRSMSGFCLNQQMFFSTDPAVLTLPYPSFNASGVPLSARPDQRVGVWLHDFGALSQPLQKFVTRELNPLLNPSVQRPLYDRGSYLLSSRPVRTSSAYGLDLLDKTTTDYLLSIQTRVQHSLDTFKQAGLAVVAPSCATVRLAGAQPAAHHQHRDCFDDASVTGAVSGRVMIHPLLGAGTGFVLNEKTGMTVACPVGATSSHLGFLKNPQTMGCEWPANIGILHRALGHDAGRGVLILETVQEPCRPDRLAHNQWLVSMRQ